MSVANRSSRWVVLIALNVLGGRHDAGADVDRAVAEREHPAVAGDRRAVAIGEVERQLDRGGVVERRGEVVADRRGVRPRAFAATCRGRARSGCWRRRRRRGTGPASRWSSRPVGGRRRRGRSRARRSARCASWPSSRVAPAATACSATSSSSRSRRATRPCVGNTGCDGQSTSTWLPRPVSRIRSMRWNAGQRVGGDAHRGELVDRAWRERVAARLHARQRPPFEDRRRGGRPWRARSRPPHRRARHR